MIEQYVIDQKRGPHIRDYSNQSQNKVVICSNTGWWADKGCGYTVKQIAGVYTRDEAYSRAGHCGPEKGCEFHDVPEDHIPTLKADVKFLRESLEKLMLSTRSEIGIGLAIDIAEDALAATAPKAGR